MTSRNIPIYSIEIQNVFPKSAIHSEGERQEFFNRSVRSRLMEIDTTGFAPDGFMNSFRARVARWVNNVLIDGLNFTPHVEEHAQQNYFKESIGFITTSRSRHNIQNTCNIDAPVILDSMQSNVIDRYISI